MRLEVHERLVEKAVLCAVEARGASRAFHRDSERSYAVEDPEQRDRSFAALNAEWFQRLDLDRPVRQALDEQPVIGQAVEACVVAAALRPSEQGAELYVEPRARTRRLRIQILPQTLLDPAAVLRTLRPELLHIADMLDPGFAYEPSLPPSQAGPTHDRLLLDRYAALWSASVRGRVRSEGNALGDERQRCLSRFLDAFPMLASQAEPIFSRFFDGPRPRHEEMVRFAQDPRKSAGLAVGLDPGTRCALCGFPSYSFATDADLDLPLRAAVQADFPRWKPENGLCPQCLELYRARA